MCSYERAEIQSSCHIQRMSATGRKFPERRSETSCRPRRDGEEAAFALGLSIARPDGLIILDVDEASLSNLGVLVTISEAAPQNFVHVLFQSGVRSGKAGLPLPRGSDTDFATIARGAGYLNAYQFDDLEELAGEAVRILNESGPTMLVIKVDPCSGGWDAASPPRRHDMSEAIRDYRANLGDADKP